MPTNIPPDGFQAGLPPKNPNTTWVTIVGDAADVPAGASQPPAESDEEVGDNEEEEQEQPTSVLDMRIPPTPLQMDNQAIQNSQNAQEEETEEETEEEETEEKQPNKLEEMVNFLMNRRVPVLQKKKELPSVDSLLAKPDPKNYESDEEYNAALANYEGKVEFGNTLLKAMVEHNKGDTYETVAQQVMVELNKGRQNAVGIKDVNQIGLFDALIDDLTYADDATRKKFLEVYEGQSPFDIATDLYRVNLAKIMNPEKSNFNQKATRRKVAQKQGLKRRKGGVRTARGTTLDPLQMAQAQRLEALAKK